VDTLLARGIQVQRVFAPEHGFRGTAANGAFIEDGLDQRSGLAVLSLHGAHRKPTAEMLRGLDYVVFDVQDVGARFYTYLSTLTLVMEACAENGIPVVVLDRPNPHGHHIAGPVLDTALTSFIGLLPVPVLHGMTLGEAARMINGEGWLAAGITCSLEVIPCIGYAHSDRWDPPIAPSPNLPTAASIALYPSLCPFEATVVSVGRGTSSPFSIIGLPAPGPGSHSFTPAPVAGAAPHPKNDGLTCQGHDLSELGTSWLSSAQGFSWHWLAEYAEVWRAIRPLEPYIDRPGALDRLTGQSTIRFALNSKNPAAALEQQTASWNAGLESFAASQARYFIYPMQR
jgi:hypothetical protein